MTNRDLLKEAIADAKVVKETAIANAKLALEETFNPFLKERLAAVLAEMDEVEEGEEELKEEMHDEPDADNMGGPSDNDADNKMEEDMDLEELLRELEEMDSLNEAEDLLNDPKTTPTAHGNIAEEDAAEGVDDDADGIPDDMDADINIEDMSTEDLESFIKDVISDMVSSGELEGGEEEEGEEEEEMEMGEEDEEEEMDIDAIVAEIKKSKAKKSPEKDDDEKEKMKKELKEAYDALKHIKSELNEVNLFNAKLLYTNKIFRNKNLSESQKVKVLAAFDKAVSVKEAKLVYETLSEGLKTTKTPVNESLLRGAASKVSGIAPKKPILEVNDQVNRWQILAGIKKII
jgi:hypothetical protein